MVATRGRPEEVTSDNGTNFVGADRELRELVLAMDQEQIADNAASDGIRWNWNPPLGSHFGGVFESLVKVAKKTVKAVVGNAGLTDNELQTAIKEVEALMNSRPLTYEGADPRDEPVLTPNHFSSWATRRTTSTSSYRSHSVQSQEPLETDSEPGEGVLEAVERRVSVNSNTRKKWREAKDNLKVGDVVLVVDQNAPRGQWRLGRVKEVFPDQDGQVHVVHVSTKGQKLIRPITRLCSLNIAGHAEYVT